MEEEIKILCVDDEPNVLNALRRLFLDDAYTILTASSGQEGIDILAKEPVQLVISDYRMPSMNGVEFLKEVYIRWPNTVRIVLSGYADASAIVGAINEGHIYKFIPKPWNDDELKVTISNSLERYFLFKKNVELTAELKQKNEELQSLNRRLEKLLEEKSRNLEYRTASLNVHQSLLDAMPVGILGVDNTDMIVMCNKSCLATCKDETGIIGNNTFSVLPDDILRFIARVKREGLSSGFISHDGARQKVIGTVVEERGIILIFVPEEDAP
ncbi:MAG: response regulator [Nitrospirae bacterium]|nr:response regulator [Nitrospirota bacterium]